jgi:asparagine synthase (glutamine-hydrolysing)
MADVPVGIFLSSGMDSTILAGLASQSSKNFECFTVAFKNRSEPDEKLIAAHSASRFGLKHRVIEIPEEQVVAEIYNWLASLDQPSIDGLNVYVISKAIRSSNIKVALSGLGADEVFGGYPSFKDIPKILKNIRTIRWCSPPLRRSIGSLLSLNKPKLVREKILDIFSGDIDLLSVYLQRRRLMSNRQLSLLGLSNPEIRELKIVDLGFNGLKEVHLNSGRNISDHISKLESLLYQSNMLLRDADANGMANSLEIRVPFLDLKLLNYVYSLPSSIRFPKNGRPKSLLRKAFPELIGSEILSKSKQGFSLPLDQWMKNSFRSLCEESLTALKDLQLLNPDGIQSIWNSFLIGKEPQMWSRALSLVVLGNFCSRF